MITVEKLHKTIKKRKILSDVSFTVAQGECIGLLGPNGAGKTTLIKCMTGVLHYEQGNITFHSKPIAQHKQDIGYLSQHTDFKPWMSFAEPSSKITAARALSQAGGSPMAAVETAPRPYIETEPLVVEPPTAAAPAQSDPEAPIATRPQPLD